MGSGSGSGSVGTNLIIELEGTLILAVLADVRFAERREVKVAPFLRVQDHVAAVSCVREVFGCLQRDLDFGSVKYLKIIVC